MFYFSSCEVGKNRIVNNINKIDRYIHAVHLLTAHHYAVLISRPKKFCATIDDGDKNEKAGLAAEHALLLLYLHRWSVNPTF